MIRPSRKGWRMRTIVAGQILDYHPICPRKVRAYFERLLYEPLAKLRGTSRGAHQPGERFGDLRVLAFREADLGARLVAIAQLQLAKRTVPRMIIGRGRKCEIPAMATGASGQPETRFPP